MVDTEMVDSAESVEQLPPLALDVFQSVKIAQSQHGLKHNDYARYRQYCKNKLQRSRKHLKLQHGRGKFVARRLEEDGILTAAHLQLPLVNAERSWAHAMESKGQLEGEHAARVRQNVLRKLNKAALYAMEFSKFASARGTKRTALEAEAYAAHLNGLALLEYPERRTTALQHLQKAKKLCEQLAKVGSFQQQAAAQQRLDEIEPLARFAQYQLSQGNQPVPATPTTPNLGAGFAELRDGEGQDTSQAAANSGPAAFAWKGNTYTVYGERQKGHVRLAEQLQSELDACKDSQQEAAILEKLSQALNEVKGIVRHSLAVSGGSGADSADALEDLKALNVAVTGKQLEITIRRNKLVAIQSQHALDNTSQSQAMQEVKRKGKRARGQGPANVVRQYDALIQNAKELTEVAGQLGGAAGEYLLDDCSAMTAEFQAKRCFYVARTYLADQKNEEACALFARAEELCQAALLAHEDCAKPDAASLQDLTQQKVLCTAWKVVAQSKALEVGEKAADGVQQLSLDTQGVQDKYLMDDLESWKSYAGGPAAAAKLAPLPPRLQLLQAKPFLLDCALDYIRPPDLSHRLPKEEKKSTIGRLFGWGTK